MYRAFKNLLRKPVYAARDIVDRLAGRFGPMVPPASMMYVGHGDFVKVGEDFKRYFIELGGLRADERVLDVGCGIGRMAIPLVPYLAARGTYWGFDIVPDAIRWCTRRITSKHGNFRFLHTDVYNKTYNPGGKVQSLEYRFPFPEASFDFIFLTSVFTHMLPADVAHYLDEITRVLAPGGRCFMTFFLLNAESRDLIAAGSSKLDFRHPMQGYTTVDPTKAEDAVAYDEAELFADIARRGLRILEPAHYGGWCGRTSFLTYQDVVIATKPRP